MQPYGYDRPSTPFPSALSRRPCCLAGIGLLASPPGSDSYLRITCYQVIPPLLGPLFGPTPLPPPALNCSLIISNLKLWHIECDGW